MTPLYLCSHLTEDGYSISHVKNLLTAQKVVDLIILPHGCLEQTMSRMVPTVVALRYLDLSEQWINLPPGSRDAALNNIEEGRNTSSSKLIMPLKVNL